MLKRIVSAFAILAIIAVARVAWRNRDELMTPRADPQQERLDACGLIVAQQRRGLVVDQNAWTRLNCAELWRELGLVQVTTEAPPKKEHPPLQADSFFSALAPIAVAVRADNGGADPPRVIISGSTPDPDGPKKLDEGARKLFPASTVETRVAVDSDDHRIFVSVGGEAGDRFGSVRRLELSFDNQQVGFSGSVYSDDARASYGAAYAGLAAKKGEPALRVYARPARTEQELRAEVAAILGKSPITFDKKGRVDGKKSHAALTALAKALKDLRGQRVELCVYLESWAFQSKVKLDGDGISLREPATASVIAALKARGVDATRLIAQPHGLSSDAVGEHVAFRFYDVEN